MMNKKRNMAFKKALDKDLVYNGYPSRIRTYGMSESESDALPLGYGAITIYVFYQKQIIVSINIH